MRAMEADVRREFPHLAEPESADLARVINTLHRAFQPERIYVFGSQARRNPSSHSDVDVLLVMRDAGQFPHHLAQEAYRVVGHHIPALDILFMSREEFEWRAKAVTSLPATILREGKLLYESGALDGRDESVHRGKEPVQHRWVTQ